MIKDKWYAVMNSYEVKSKPVGVTRFNEKLVLWREDNGKLNCICDRCCHRGASLELGRINNNHLACPFHGFEYDGSGKVVVIPAMGRKYEVPERYRIESYHVAEKADLIWIWYGEAEPTEEIPFFDELLDGFVYGEFSKTWNVHLTRAIENQLDVVHLPFVHETTIGRGNRTIVDGPVVEWDNDRMTVYVQNRRDNGQEIALKASEIDNYRSLFRVKLQLPNTWQNLISDKVRIFVAFVPVDDHHTKIYLRFYQKFLPNRLGGIVAKISNQFNKIILHQDRRVVLTQLPDHTQLKMDEKLIPGDLPIVEYRKKLAQYGGDK